MAWDKDLNPVLKSASNKDLEVLVSYIEMEFSEGLTNNEKYLKWNPDHSKYTNVIADEIRLFGGNTFVNVVRGSGPSYREIVCDVADKFKATYKENSPIKHIELAILMKIFSDAYDNKMTKKEKKEFLKSLKLNINNSIPKTFPFIAVQAAIKNSGFLGYKLSVIIANKVARMILGRGLAFATNSALTKYIATFAGPIGWAITGLWTLIDIAGPSFKVTMPCVIHIAYLRQNYYYKKAIIKK